MADLLSQGFQSLTLNQQESLKSIAPTKHRIVSLAQQPPGASSCFISACTLSQQVYLLDSARLSVSFCLDLNSCPRIKPKPRVLSEARFGRNADPNALFVISQDEGLFRWDTRAPQTAAQRFECDAISSLGLSFLSLDMNSDDRVIAAGSSASKNGDAFLGFWDVRLPTSGTFLGVYSQSHSEDVAALAFHPVAPNRLLSGACDGLMCSFDLDARKEEDALELSCNSERSLYRVGWSGDGMFCLSDMGTYHAWSAEGDLEKEVTQLPEPWRYLVDFLSDRAALLMGDHEGNLALLPTNRDSPTPYPLQGGHSDTVRASVLLPGGHLVTGGEDGLVCVWRSGEVCAQPPVKRLKLPDSLTPKKKKRKKNDAS